MQSYTYGTGIVTKDDNIIGRAVEIFDVSFYPVKGGDLIEHAIITGRLRVCRREESENV